MAPVRQWSFVAAAATLVIVTALYLMQTTQSDTLPDGLFVGNGRVEGTEVKVAAKYSGRITEIIPKEGDDVGNGTIIVRLDNREALASLAEARAKYEQIQHVAHSAKADIERRTNELAFAEGQLKRTRQLFGRGNVSQQKLDRDNTAKSTAAAALDRANAVLMQSEAQLASAQAQVDRYKAIVSETEIAAPISGRVLFRIAEPGEIIQAGGNILLLVDLDRLYMTIYADEVSAGRINVGDDALIWTDAYPDNPFKARVTFVSSKAEFTPKEVETSEERQNLVFQVKITAIDNTDRRLKPGMPGIGVIRTSGDVPWPQKMPRQ